MTIRKFVKALLETCIDTDCLITVNNRISDEYERSLYIYDNTAENICKSFGRNLAAYFDAMKNGSYDVYEPYYRIYEDTPHVYDPGTPTTRLIGLDVLSARKAAIENILAALSVYVDDAIDNADSFHEDLKCVAGVLDTYGIENCYAQFSTVLNSLLK